MASSVIFRGDDDIIAKLEAIGSKAKRREVRRPGAIIIRDAMRSRVPRRTSNLHDDIDVRPHGDDDLAVGISEEGFYGYFVDRGTAYAPARPWFNAGFDAARPNATAAIRRELTKIVDSTWGR